MVLFRSQILLLTDQHPLHLWFPNCDLWLPGDPWKQPGQPLHPSSLEALTLPQSQHSPRKSRQKMETMAFILLLGSPALPELNWGFCSCYFAFTFFGAVISSKGIFTIVNQGKVDGGKEIWTLNGFSWPLLQEVRAKHLFWLWASGFSLLQVKKFWAKLHFCTHCHLLSVAAKSVAIASKLQMCRPREKSRGKTKGIKKPQYAFLFL